MTPRDARIEALQRKIKTLHETVWERRADWPSVLEWIEQFTGPRSNDKHDEQLQALYLLSHFMYFGTEEIRALLRSLYRDMIKAHIISGIRKSTSDTLDRQFINIALMDTLTKTRFLSLGNPSESSALILYYFRQENRLPKSLFCGSLDVFDLQAQPLALRDPLIEHYIFMDDMCGSGIQGEEYSRGVAAAIKSLNPNATLHYYSIFGLEGGLNRIRQIGVFDVVRAVVELDESFKCFSSTSRVYDGKAEEHENAAARAIFENYGSSLVPKHPLGFNDGQLILGFTYNTPDNTLPVFWADNDTGVSWQPVFKRYPKIVW